MKNTIFIFLLFAMLSSCDDREAIITEPSIPERWQLVEIYGSIAGMPPLSGEDILEPEYYLLYQGGVFTKKRTIESGVISASGTYELKEEESGSYFLLTYESDHQILNNCTGLPQEYITITDNNRLENIESSACDGPRLVYEQVAGTE